MRKRTGSQTRKQNLTSVLQPTGLTVKDAHPQQSARPEPILDSRSHRTALGFTCRIIFLVRNACCKTRVPYAAVYPDRCKPLLERTASPRSHRRRQA